MYRISVQNGREPQCRALLLSRSKQDKLFYSDRSAVASLSLMMAHSGAIPSTQAFGVTPPHMAVTAYVVSQTLWGLLALRLVQAIQ